MATVWLTLISHGVVQKGNCMADVYESGSPTKWLPFG